ncbi:hypothetical protein PROFUN_16208 [Planoprotostelium fungivorum]|uniref:Integrase catalytic domain-containing protein n=1 Tax=Planoprotostelium fungivorum TaxID=1890364 RepID=A0A2P6MRP1_9EUKA|nr:hypothetical protein PROFUN_16208 [Planoprotostelium fungivorum]
MSLALHQKTRVNFVSSCSVLPNSKWQDETETKTSNFLSRWIQKLQDKTQIFMSLQVLKKCVEQYDDPDAKYEQFGFTVFRGLLNYCWPTELPANIVVYCNNKSSECHGCNQHNGTAEKYREPSRAIPVSKKRERLVFDITYMETNKFGKKYIVLGVDAFTKKAWGRALKVRTAAAVTQWLEETFVAPGDGFEIYHTDNGTEFDNAQVLEYITSRGGIWVHSKPRNPKCQGHVESLDKTIKKMIGKQQIYSGEEDWEVVFLAMLDRYNNRMHSTTRMAHNKLDNWPGDRTAIDEKIARRIVKLGKLNASQRDKGHIPWHLEVGMFLMVRDSSWSRGKTQNRVKKLQLRWITTEVTEKLSDETESVQGKDGQKKGDISNWLRPTEVALISGQQADDEYDEYAPANPDSAFPLPITLPREVRPTMAQRPTLALALPPSPVTVAPHKMRAFTLDALKDVEEKRQQDMAQLMEQVTQTQIKSFATKPGCKCQLIAGPATPGLQLYTEGSEGYFPY